MSETTGPAPTTPAAITPERIDLEPIVKLLQRDVPAGAMPYFKALRACVWEIERMRSASKALAEFGEKTGASPWA